MTRCVRCNGRFDPLSRQASQNAMGPWAIRDEASPFAPGCSLETIRALIERGRIGPNTIIRGPTTNQFWTLAKRTPGVANVLGVCHNCQRPASPDEFACRSCHAPFVSDADRQHLGLAPLQMLPGRAAPEVIAALSGPPPADALPPTAREPISPFRPARADSVHIEPPQSGPSRLPPSLVGLAVVLLALAGAAVLIGPQRLASWFSNVPTPGAPPEEVAEGPSPPGPGVSLSPSDQVPAQDTGATSTDSVGPVAPGPPPVDAIHALLAQDTDQALQEAIDLASRTPQDPAVADAAAVARRRLERHRLQRLP